MGYVYLRAKEIFVENARNAKQVNCCPNKNSRSTPRLQRLIKNQNEACDRKVYQGGIRKSRNKPGARKANRIFQAKNSRWLKHHREKVQITSKTYFTGVYEGRYEKKRPCCPYSEAVGEYETP